MDKKGIMVVTNKYAPDVDLVIRQLYEIGERVVRLNTEDFPTRVGYEYSSRNGKMLFYLPAGKEIDPTTIKSIFYRKPLPPLISSEIEEEPVKLFAKRESEAVLRAFYGCFQGLWVNHPLRLRLSSQKILQLERAKEVGLQIPPTLVTNNPDRARQFWEECEEEGVIVKPLSFPLIEGEGEHCTLSTSLVTEDSLERIEQVKYSPVLFQARVPKEYELRITVVTNEVFTCKIFSQVSSKTRLDWRFFDQEDPIPHEAGRLSPEIKSKCIDLTRKLGLKYGAIDMVLTPQGDYIFLEINPSGMWGWIEGLTGLPISKAVARLLAGGE